ncbi:MAG: carboxy terminal-processing peptidase [Kiritimatiellae bacterium]|nr:carboxy terminal-processing peptidase [Kiritimatiellia bacterium]
MRLGAKLLSAIALAMAGAAVLAAPEAPEESLYDDTAPTRIASLEIPDNFPRLCRRFALLLETRHFLQKPLDVSVSRQAWSNYISRLDYDHSIFLQSDIDSFLPWQEKLHTDLKRGDMEFAVTVFERFRERLRERAAFVENFLDQEQDFSVDEEYTWKRKDAPWPEDRAAQDELWRRRMKSELLSRIVARDYAEEKAAATNATAAATSADTPQPPCGPSDSADTSSSANLPQPLHGPSEPANTATSTNLPQPPCGVADSATNAPPAIDMSPEAVVRRRYKQYLGIVNDADADYVSERFLCAFAEVYDPHSSYMPPMRTEDFNIEMNLTLCGIGATLQSEDGMAKIVKIIPGGPADRDTRDIRLRDGDKIFGVGQGDDPVEDIVHLPLDKIVKRIRGKKGTKVVLHVISGADPSGTTTKVVDLIRDDIKLEESAATGRVVRVEGRAFGYVDLPSFYGTMGKPGDENFRSCTEDVKTIMAGFNDEVEGMILDLRGNGGGSLREAVTLAGSFIRIGPMVAVRESRGAQPLLDTDPSIAFRKPLVVMIDRASASASEIVAAALQDYGRAIVVGDTKSHGKGSVQNVMPLINGDESYGTLKVTIAAFYRVNGRSTQIDGVSSDIVLPSILEYMDIGEDKLPSALPATRIPPLGYSIAYPIGSLIPGLREKSAARLADNEEWQRHLKRVEHVREITDRTTLPLCYEKRMALMRADAEYDLDSESDLLDEEEDIENGDSLDGQAEPGQRGSGAAEAPASDANLPQPPCGPSDSADTSSSANLPQPPCGVADTQDDGIGKDIVLREAFNILSDLCDAQGEKGISPSQDQDVSDWLYRLFR